MRRGCIAHPEGEPYIVIHKWQMDFCDGNACAAALLSVFEYWHDVRLNARDMAFKQQEVSKRHGEEVTYDTSVLQAHTEQDLEREVMIYGRVTIAKAVTLLVEKGAVTIWRNPDPRYSFDQTRHFEFHPSVIDDFLATRGKWS